MQIVKGPQTRTWTQILPVLGWKRGQQAKRCQEGESLKLVLCLIHQFSHVILGLLWILESERKLILSVRSCRWRRNKKEFQTMDHWQDDVLTKLRHVIHFARKSKALKITTFTMSLLMHKMSCKVSQRQAESTPLYKTKIFVIAKHLKPSHRVRMVLEC